MSIPYIYEVFRIESRLVEAYGWGREIGRKWEVTANGCEFSFCDDEHVLKLIMVMLTKLCENTEKH